MLSFDTFLVSKATYLTRVYLYYSLTVSILLINSMTGVNTKTILRGYTLWNDFFGYERNRKAGGAIEKEGNTLHFVYFHLLPSSVWVSHGHAACTAAPPADSTGVRWWRRTSTGAHLIVFPAGRRRGSAGPSAWGHSVESTVSCTRPAPTHGKPSQKPTTAAPLFKHHSESTIFIGFVVKVGVIWVCTTLYGSLGKEDQGEYIDNL